MFREIPDNEGNEINSLAGRIRQEVSQWSVCEIKKADLSVIWGCDDKLSDMQMLASVENFAIRHQFLFVVDNSLRYAIFR